MSMSQKPPTVSTPRLSGVTSMSSGERGRGGGGAAGAAGEVRGSPGSVRAGAVLGLAGASSTSKGETGVCGGTSKTRVLLATPGKNCSFMAGLARERWRRPGCGGRRQGRGRGSADRDHAVEQDSSSGDRILLRQRLHHRLLGDARMLRAARTRWLAGPVEQGSLDGRAERDDLVGVDPHDRRATEELLDLARHHRHARRAAHEDDRDRARRAWRRTRRAPAGTP